MGKTMRAWVFRGPEKMAVEEVAVPAVEEGELLVKVRAVGICGSDVSYYFGHSPLGTPDGGGPLILGHEISGDVVRVGGAAARAGLFREGERVTLNPVQQCNACPACADGRFNVCPSCEVLGVSHDGGFAEYVKVRHTHAFKIDDSVSYEAAALTEPLACATYAMRKLEVRMGDYAVIIGSGSIGLMMLQIAKARGAGATVLVGTRDVPLRAALELGADAAINVRDAASEYYAADVVARIREIGGGRLADRVVVPTAAVSAMRQALEVSGPCSTIVYFGLPGPGDMIQVPALTTGQADKTIKFSWLAPLVWPEAIAAMRCGKVDASRLLSHRYRFDEVEKGIRDMAAGLPDKIKGVAVL